MPSPTIASGEFVTGTLVTSDDLLLPVLSEALTLRQKRSKVSNLLTKLRKADVIENRGCKQRPQWELV